MEKAGEVNYPLIWLIRKDGAQLYQTPVKNRIEYLTWNSVSEHVFEAKNDPAACPVLIKLGPEQRKKNKQGISRKGSLKIMLHVLLLFSFTLAEVFLNRIAVNLPPLSLNPG